MTEKIWIISASIWLFKKKEKFINHD